MSEYQYYEFQAIDRPLDQNEMAELRALSTRANITATSFINTYNYGSFRGDPVKLMEQYFDAFLYLANWGTHRLMFRLPRKLVDIPAIEAYGIEEEGLSVRGVGDHVLLDFFSDEEGGGDWEAGEGQLASMISLRADLLNGDLRCLYLAWLACIQNWGSGRDYDEEDVDGEGSSDEDDRAPEDDESGDLDVLGEPPVPPGLGNLSAPLQAFADFLRIDPELIAVAAERSIGEAPAGPSRDDLARWIGTLPDREKAGFLLRLALEPGPHPRAELLRRFRESQAQGARAAAQAAVKRRSVPELLAARDALAKERRQREAERQAQERARQAREQAAARAQHLAALAPREAATWKEVDALIATKRPKEYARALELLGDLRDLGEREGRDTEFATRLKKLREQHASKSSLLRRFNEAGFP